MQSLRPIVLVACCALAGISQAQQVLLDTTLTLGDKPDPVVLDFAAPAGNYRMTVTDFGTPAGPVRLGRVDAAVMHGSAVVTSLSLTSAGSNVGVKNFAATAGAQRLVLTARPTAPATVGSVGVQIDDPVSGAVLLETVKIFTVPPAPTASPGLFEDEFAVGAGTYTLEVTDFALPASMTLNVVVAPKSNPTNLTPVTPGLPLTLTTGAAETYQVIVAATLATGASRGVLGVNLSDASGSIVGSKTHEVGDWPYRYTFDAVASGTLTASLSDLGFPFPLLTLAAQIVRDGRAVSPRLAAASSSTFAASAGTYTVYVDASPAATGPGSFGLKVGAASPATPVLETVRNVVAAGPITDMGAIDRAFDIATPGDYKLTLTDFGLSGFFDAFTSVSLALTRDNAIVQTLNGPGNFTFAATPGHYDIAIIGDPAGAAGEGLLSVRVQSLATSVVVYEATEAVGTDFLTSTFAVTSAQSVDVRVADLAFAAPFDSVKLAVTHGSERVGEIVGAGTFSFAATPGTYIVNLLAVPSSAVGYSTIGVNAIVTPAVPGLTFGASSNQIATGGNVTLTWASTDTTSCTASGGWNGARATSGTETVGPLNANTTFTLSCLGPGGSKDANVSVTITGAERSGGGGAVDLWLLGGLALAALARRRRWGATDTRP